MFRSVFLGDPGPCPVDDAPHTTCVSPDYHGEGVLVTVRRPLVLDAWPAPPIVATEPPPPPVTFTTGTYQREVHGPRRGRGRRG